MVSTARAWSHPERRSPRDLTTNKRKWSRQSQISRHEFLVGTELGRCHIGEREGSHCVSKTVRFLLEQQTHWQELCRCSGTVRVDREPQALSRPRSALLFLVVRVCPCVSHKRDSGAHERRGVSPKRRHDGDSPTQVEGEIVRTVPFDDHVRQ
jgi:hypothetical protein